MLESLGAIELGGKDERIEAGFVDEDGLLCSAQAIDDGVFCKHIIVQASLPLVWSATPVPRTHPSGSQIV